MHRTSTRVMGVWNQWINEYRTAQNSETGLRTVTSPQDDRQMAYMVLGQYCFIWIIGNTLVNCYKFITVCIRQFVIVCCTIFCLQNFVYTGSFSCESIFSCCWNVLMSIETGTQISKKNFFHEFSFYLVVISWPHYAGERYLLERIVERHSGQPLGVIGCNAVAHLGRSQLQRIIKQTDVPMKCWSSMSLHFFKAFPQLYLHWNIPHLYVSKRVGCRTYMASYVAFVFFGYVVHWTCGNFVDWSIELFPLLITLYICNKLLNQLL